MGNLVMIKKRNDPEHEQQVILFNWIKLNENKHPKLKTVFAIPNGGHRYISVARKLKAEGVKAGVWDIFVMSLKVRGLDKIRFIVYCGLYIEMKIKPNKLSANQKAFRELGKSHYQFEVCYSGIEAIEVLKEYLGL